MNVLKHSTYEYDYAKLQALVCREYKYKYTWGIHLTFFEARTVVQIFQCDKIFKFKYELTTKKLVDME